jgi:beta-exotoxin I transport system permease protein
VNLRLFRQTLRWNRVKLLAVAAAAVGWGFLLPIIYTSFSEAFRQLVNSGTIPKQLLSFGSGNFFTLPGALTLGLEHPLAIAFMGIFAVGSTVAAVAGERERGTLEVLLARPIARRGLYWTLAAATVVLLAIIMAALLGGQIIGIAIQGLGDQINLGYMPLVFLNGLMLWAAFAAFGLAASVSFDRSAPALGLTLAYLLVNYFLEILGSLWTDVAWSQQYSLFHHFQPGHILDGKADLLDLVILGIAILVPAVYSLVAFPRRDLAAPS